MLNPITYTEDVVSDFLRYQLSTYAFADEISTSRCATCSTWSTPAIRR